MTSFIIGAHTNRSIPTEWRDDADRNCPFCRIIADEMPSTRLYEDDKVIAILDILPLRRGHTLVIPKAHYSRVSELPPEYASAVGQAVTRVANGLTKALDNTALNVVCNQEYAQAVPHVHYHIIPAPSFGSSAVEPLEKAKENEIPLSRREMHQREFESREELDEDEGKVLAVRIRASL
ncbi:HIT-like domain-containing protein [Suillus subaureus]|uniref:HIT-like domain-containing protein n=1 Tax=Suillus subaureus TaxID=48587 RepID=A0A9P7J9H0_9AGAM|nr:HIT-like domain-containing protein [Suillus subaureus]KAG1809704.1 HIT-like domain-containing protein [Suillus subaureus]